jgi:hypothetical protein
VIGWITTTAGVLFSGSVVAFALVVIAVPSWPAFGIISAVIVLLVGLLLFVRRRHKRRSGTDKSLEPEQGRE